MYDTKLKEKVALKLNSLSDKKTRSHKKFLTKFHNDKTILQGLSVYVEPSIGNQDRTFLENWHEKLQSFSLTQMSEVIKFCDQTIYSF